MPPSLLSVGPTKVFFDINGGDGASTSNSLQPLHFLTPTKFYVQFTVTPVDEFHFLLTRRRSRHRSAAVKLGVVLERDAGGRISAAVWRGTAVDALAGATGLGAADAIAKAMVVRLGGLDKGRERVAVGVEVEVVTPMVVALDKVVDVVAEPATACAAARQGCEFCGEALARDLVVRRARCSHYFHRDCLAFLVGRGLTSCPSCGHAFSV